MLNKFNNRTSLFVNATLAIPVFFFLYLIYKGLDITPSLFYSLISLLLSSIMVRNMYWMYVSDSELRVKYFSLFKQDVQVELKNIVTIEFEEKNSLIERMLYVGNRRSDYLYITTITGFDEEIITLKSNLAVNLRELYKVLKKSV